MGRRTRKLCPSKPLQITMQSLQTPFSLADIPQRLTCQTSAMHQHQRPQTSAICLPMSQSPNRQCPSPHHPSTNRVRTMLLNMLCVRQYFYMQL